MCLAISVSNARTTSSIFQVCFSLWIFFVTSECMNSFILFCQCYISNTRLSVPLATTTTLLSCFFVYWIAVDRIRVSASLLHFWISCPSFARCFESNSINFALFFMKLECANQLLYRRMHSLNVSDAYGLWYLPSHHIHQI